MSGADAETPDRQEPKTVGENEVEGDLTFLDEERQGSKRRGHGRWMMVACCVPMLLIAVVLVATGAGAGFLVVAVACTAMMVAMMGLMSGGGK